jgi:hypothetical protein
MLVTDGKKRLQCFDSFFIETSMLPSTEEAPILEISNAIQIESAPTVERKLTSSFKIPKQISNLMLNKVEKMQGYYLLELNDETKWKSFELTWNDSDLIKDSKVEIISGFLGSTFIKVQGTKIKLRVKQVN